MKYHKIRGVAMDICTAEQKIAYNLAWSHRDFVLRAGFSTWQDASRKLVEFFTNAYDYKPGKYDIDAIFCALNAGLKEYCKNPFISTDYETIGKAFPALYLNK